jgi:branched-chain amino acid transport system ATP-binding protein/neutral amino acid transport system ATP-binding protein
VTIPALDVSGLFAGYGSGDIVKGISFTLPAEAVYTVIGPNGSGKSTLIKALAGLVRPRVGSIRLTGQDVTTLTTAQRVSRGLAYVPQEFNVFANMTVAENLKLATEFISGFGTQGRARSDDEIFALFPELADRGKAMAGHLSGGQRQMLAFACALKARPEVLLLDEPSAGLSPRYAAETFDTVARINENGVTVLVVEQRVRDALRVSSTCLVMANGQLRMSLPAADVLATRDIRSLYLGDQGAEPAPEPHLQRGAA